MQLIPSKQAVLFKLREPSRIMTVIPTAKEMHPGSGLVAVPHRPDETRVLRNLGYEVPAPMPLHYQWTGPIPFQVQRESASFMTMHDRCFCLNGMGCVDATTEYLTPTGWRRIDQYVGGVVGQYNPTTRAVEFVEPTEYVKLPCTDMLRIKTTRGIDQLLSPEHRVLLHSRRGGTKTEVVQAAELYARQEAVIDGTSRRGKHTTIGWRDASIPVVFGAGGEGIPLTDAQIRLQVAVIADGYFGSSGTGCVVRLKRERKVARFRGLLDACGVAYTARTITEADERSDTGFTIFHFHAPLRDKEFGAYWWGASSAQLQVVADEVMHWDGSFSQNENRGPAFFSVSKVSADFVQYAFVACGHSARLSDDGRTYATTGGPCYMVSVRTGVTSIGLHGTSSDGAARSPIQPEPSVDGFKYCFMVPSTFLVFRRNGCVFASGNTGKTYTSLSAFDYLRSVKQAKKALVICPLSTMEDTWAKTVFRNFPHLDAVVVYGSAERRLKLLKQEADVYIINTDGLKSIAKELAKRPDIDLIVVDEMAMYRNSGTERWKQLNMVCNKQTTRKVWALTGAPIPHEPTDAWAQCRIVFPNSKRVPPYFSRFRELVMRQVSQFKWVAKDNATDVVFEMMQPAIRYALDDCLDLPPQTILTRDVEMEPEQKTAYKAMLAKLKAEFDGGQIMASNEAIKASKLLQISLGVAYGMDGEHVVLPSNSRMEVLKEVIEQSEGKVIVFVPLTGALEQVAAELSKDTTVAVVHGGTSKDARDEVFDSFQNHPDPRVLVANPKTMSHGLTLTAATTIVWYGPTNSNDVYVQACARVRRPGQTRTTVIVHIVSNELERRVFERLDKKQKMQNVLLDLLKDNKELT